MIMGLTERFEDQRERTALGRAQPYLEEDEEILHWARVRHSDTRKEGFAYVTARRLLLRWQGRTADGHQEFRWEELRSWGIQPDASGGPVLCVEADEQDAILQIPARSHGVARRVSDFLRHFARQAPSPSRALSGPDKEGFEPHEDVEVTPQRRSALGQTRRILVTVIGLALIVVATLIIPLPGPWSILLTIAGLAVLATEYDWAQDLSDFLRDKYEDARRKIKARRQSVG
ncbi:MAG: PGPGW domain-containing protein [Actinomycetota bacterium]|nr:PGPGW domain-containing protein [Actinomycetota bacterium]